MSLHEIDAFFERIRQPHGGVHPCFMTGKACIFTDTILRDIQKRLRILSFAGFAIMPFRPNTDLVFETTVKPFFKAMCGSQLNLERGDMVGQQAQVLCEGICKQIQQADFVTADISVPNHNVLYELGLAYAIGQKLFVMHEASSSFGATLGARLRECGCQVYVYQALEPFHELQVSPYLWARRASTADLRTESKVLYLEYLKPDQGRNARSDEGFSGDIPLEDRKQILSAIRAALATVTQDLKGSELMSAESLREISKLLAVTIVDPHGSVPEIMTAIDTCYCIVIRTGNADCDAMTYFWLGYSHGRGKNMIPVTVIRRLSDRVDDLAFDTRSLRYTILSKDAPRRLQEQLKATYRRMIEADYPQWARRRFWSEATGMRSGISIFIGALHNAQYQREMVGDWDLRTASELTSYLASQQYRFRLESPVYSPETFSQPTKPGSTAFEMAAYIDLLINQIRNKNCVIVGAADVNPLTEVVLGTIYGVKREKWFASAEERSPLAIVLFKETTGAAGAVAVQRGFYATKVTTQAGALRRGFESAHIRKAQGQAATTFLSQTEDDIHYDVYAHLVVARNPYTDIASDPRYIIILNGVTGQATFALAHALTGGFRTESMAYDEGFRPEVKSEELLSKLMDALEQDRRAAVECLVRVKAGPGPASERAGVFDWRRVFEWALDKEAFPPDGIKVTPF